jgi:hypothetical protein
MRKIPTLRSAQDGAPQQKKAAQFAAFSDPIQDVPLSGAMRYLVRFIAPNERLVVVCTT